MEGGCLKLPPFFYRDFEAVLPLQIALQLPNLDTQARSKQLTRFLRIQKLHATHGLRGRPRKPIVRREAEAPCVGHGNPGGLSFSQTARRDQLIIEFVLLGQQQWSNGFVVAVQPCQHGAAPASIATEFSGDLRRNNEGFGVGAQLPEEPEASELDNAVGVQDDRELGCVLQGHAEITAPRGQLRNPARSPDPHPDIQLSGPWKSDVARALA